jgi:hypothetical protein
MFLGTIVFLVSYPNIYYFTTRVFHREIGQEAWGQFTSLRSFLFTQVLSLVFLMVLCAFCGFSFSQRNNLPGLGRFSDLKENALKQYLPLSLLLIATSYIFFDYWFMPLAPGFYPKQVHWALTIPFRSAFMEELVFRFGLVTVLVGATKKFLSPLWAVGVVSIFYALTMTGKTFDLVGIQWQMNFQHGGMVVSSFFTSFLLGYVYVKKGLISAIFLHFCIGLKYIVFAVAF